MIIMSEPSDSPSPSVSTNTDDNGDLLSNTKFNTTNDLSMSEDRESDQEDFTIGDEKELNALDLPRSLTSPSTNDPANSTASADLDAELLGDLPTVSGNDSERNSLLPTVLPLRILLLSLQLSLERPYAVGMDAGDFLLPVAIDILNEGYEDSICPICLHKYDAPSGTNLNPLSSDPSLENNDNAVRLKACGHVMGKYCIKKWIHTGSESCPICRTPLAVRESDPLRDSEDEILRAFISSARVYLLTRNREAIVSDFMYWASSVDEAGTDENAESHYAARTTVERFSDLMSNWD